MSIIVSASMSASATKTSPDTPITYTETVEPQNTLRFIRLPTSTNYLSNSLTESSYKEVESMSEIIEEMPSGMLKP